MSKSIMPTNGRVLWYYAPGVPIEAEPEAAIVAKVHSDICVNLTVFGHDGTPRPERSVLLVQGEPDRAPITGGWCRWMPYQMGQAARTEARSPLTGLKTPGT